RGLMDGDTAVRVVNVVAVDDDAAGGIDVDAELAAGDLVPVAGAQAAEDDVAHLGVEAGVDVDRRCDRRAADLLAVYVHAELVAADGHVRRGEEAVAEPIAGDDV